MSILSAVTAGEGFGRPRLSGLVYLGLSVACLLVGAGLATRGVLAYVLLPLGPVYALSGLWLAAVGAPEAVPRPQKPALWTRVGLGVCLGVGLAAGLLADVTFYFG